MRKTVLITLKILGASLSALVLVFALGVIWPLPLPQPNTRPEKLVIQNVTVVDVEAGGLVAGQDITVIGDAIISVTSNADGTGATVIDGTGQFAIPGLFDMHMHSFKLAPELTHPMFVAHGVTAVRDMGGCLGEPDAWTACADDKRGWTRAVENARIVGPRYDQITGLAINGGLAVPDGTPGDLGAATPKGARVRATHDAARGMDFLKTYTELPKDSYRALAEAAKDEGLYLAGHLPWAVTAPEAIAAGQRSFEHALLFIFECYPGIDELRATTDFRGSYGNTRRLTMIAEHDPARCQNLFTQMGDAGTAFVPTHTTRKLDAYATDPVYRGDDRLRYIPAPLRMMWLQDADNMAARAAASEGASSYKAIYDFGLQLTGAAHRAGVTVMAGTDAPDSFTFPGASLADEMEHLVIAGLSPLDALRAATLTPARFLGMEGRAGIIRAGARADIVLLRENPLQDIGAVRSIETTLLAGVPYDRGNLDQMLAGVETAAGSWSMWPKFIWQIARSPLMLKQFAD